MKPTICLTPKKWPMAMPTLRVGISRRRAKGLQLASLRPLPFPRGKIAADEFFEPFHVGAVVLSEARAGLGIDGWID